MTIQEDTEGELKATLKEIGVQLTTVAVTFERVNARLESLERWQREAEDEKRRREDRNWHRTNELLPQSVRDNAALLISLGALLFLVLPHLLIGWRP